MKKIGRRRKEILAKREEKQCASLKDPTVLSEWKTLERVLNGQSLSRYGDGELKHMNGRRNVSQVFFTSLQKAITDVFHSRSKSHLVAIPNVYSGRVFPDNHPDYIESMRRKFKKLADPGYTYGSAYITRGDLCPYLAHGSYWSVISELWAGRDVVLVRGNVNRAAPGDMMAKARNLDHVETPSAGAWSEYDRILSDCLAHPAESIYLLCVGPTATVLAYDLCSKGRWAVDIGHLGLFYKRLGIEFDSDPQVWHHRPTDPGYAPGNEY